MGLGENIYKYRTEKKLSQEDFASAMEVSRQSVSKWENNQAVPELDKLIKMAKLFEISLDELVGNTPPVSPSAETVTPVPSVTSGDLISIVFLFLTIIVPLLVWLTGELHDSTLLFYVSIFVLPPLFTFVASRFSPDNSTIRKAFLILNATFSAVVFLLCITVPLLGLLLVFVYMIPLLLWPTNSKQ